MPVAVMGLSSPLPVSYSKVSLVRVIIPLR
jgi:hypothetical protein